VYDLFRAVGLVEPRPSACITRLAAIGQLARTAGGRGIHAEVAAQRLAAVRVGSTGGATGADRITAIRDVA
jgi:hypothetical protein